MRNWRYQKVGYLFAVGALVFCDRVHWQPALQACVVFFPFGEYLGVAGAVTEGFADEVSPERKAGAVLKQVIPFGVRDPNWERNGVERRLETACGMFRGLLRFP